MSVQVRRRREAAAFLASFVGAQGELIVDTTNNRVQVHDGTTPGGWPAARLADVLGRMALADVSYTALASDRTIAFTRLTAARTVTLPAASAYPVGTQLLVVDESGAASATLRITLSASGADRINGVASAIIGVPYGFVALTSNGSNRWTIVDQSTGSVPALLGAPVANFLFTPGGDGTVSIFRNTTSHAQNPRTSTLSAVSGTLLTLSGSSDAGLFFDTNMQGVVYARIWNTTRGTSAWVATTPAANQIGITNAGDVAGWVAGDTLQIGDPASQHTGLNVIALDISPMLIRLFGQAFAQTGILCKCAIAGVQANLSLTGSAVSGSFVAISTPSDGSTMNGMVLVPCTVASPISASNLVFLRESIASGANPITTSIVSSLAVFA